jgi:5'-nucleotidase
MSPVSESGSAGAGKRHVVSHDWVGIRDAMHVAKNEHLSGVDVCVS